MDRIAYRDFSGEMAKRKLAIEMEQMIRNLQSIKDNVVSVNRGLMSTEDETLPYPIDQRVLSLFDQLQGAFQEVVIGLRKSLQQNQAKRTDLVVSKELMKIARELVAVDFRSKKELDNYLKQHPKADRSKHRVVNQKSKRSPTPEVETGHRKTTPSVQSLSKVKNILNAHGLNEESDELGELAGFKRTLGQRVPQADFGKYLVRNVSKLKKDFITNMKPGNYESPEAFKSAKARLQKMPEGDFGKILAAINSEEE